jgi:hypothetical protein
MKQVTALNIDDFIRGAKSKGVFSIPWTEEQFAILQKFKPNLKDGDKYLGVEHYLIEDKNLS